MSFGSYIDLVRSTAAFISEASGEVTAITIKSAYHGHLATKVKLGASSVKIKSAVHAHSASNVVLTGGGGSKQATMFLSI